MIFEQARKMLTEDVRQSLLRGVDVNSVDRSDKSKTLLHIAAQTGNSAMIKMLKVFEPEVDARDDTGMTPLFYAIEAKSADSLRTLLDMGADPNAQDN